MKHQRGAGPVPLSIRWDTNRSRAIWGPVPSRFVTVLLPQSVLLFTSGFANLPYFCKGKSSLSHHLFPNGTDKKSLFFAIFVFTQLKSEIPLLPCWVRTNAFNPRGKHTKGTMCLLVNLLCLSLLQLVNLLLLSEFHCPSCGSGGISLGSEFWVSLGPIQGAAGQHLRWGSH